MCNVIYVSWQGNLKACAFDINKAFHFISIPRFIISGFWPLFLRRLPKPIHVHRTVTICYRLSRSWREAGLISGFQHPLFIPRVRFYCKHCCTKTKNPRRDCFFRPFKPRANGPLRRFGLHVWFSSQCAETGGSAGPFRGKAGKPCLEAFSSKPHAQLVCSVVL